MTTTVDRPNGTALAARDGADIIEQVIIQGDLAKLSPEQRVSYYRAVCESLGLNPHTRPFEYIVLNGKLTLYARKDCGDQLRKLHGVSVTKLERDHMGDLYAVTAYATDKGGRQDSAIGAVSITGLKGEALANALMKAETKAKRRVTLSLCGLGWPDESEIDTAPSARTLVVDSATGEILEERPAPPAAPPPQPETKRQPARPSKMLTDPQEPMWQRWEALKSEAEAVGLVVSELKLPIGAQLLQAEGIKLRKAVAEHKKQPASGETTMVTSKDDPLWQQWLEAEAKIRKHGLRLDTSQVHLPITQESLRASIDGLLEALKSSDLDIPF